MKNKKILIANILIITIAVLSIIAISLSDFDFSKLKGDITSTATASTYYDWSALQPIDVDYSYSTLFYKENTEFYASVSKASGGSVDPEKSYTTTLFEDNKPSPAFFLYNAGDQASIIMKNVGIDSNGNNLNAVLHIKVDKIWPDDFIKSGDSNNVPVVEFRLAISSTNTGSQSKMNVSPEGNSGVSTPNKIGYNMPLGFYLNTKKASVEADLTYYSTLNVTPTGNSITTRFNENSLTGKEVKLATYSGNVATNMTKVNSFYYDIDITNPNKNNPDTGYDEVISGTKYGAAYDYGHERIIPLNGQSKIYYNKTGNTTFEFKNIDNNATLSGYTYKLAESHNGLYISQNSGIDTSAQEVNVTGPWYATSANFLTSNLAGTYKFAYGTRSCGTVFFFATPAGYKIPNPTKSVSKTTAKVKETFEYEISQYIPNNYVTNIVNYSSIYSNFKPDNNISSISFEDQFDANLQIDTSNLTIKDENGKSLLPYWGLNFANNKLTTSATTSASAYLNSAAAYNKFIKIKVPVYYKNKITENKTVTNFATRSLIVGSTDDLTSSQIQENTDTKNTNTVSTIITPIKLTYDCNGGQPSTPAITYPNLNETVSLLKSATDNVIVCSKTNYTHIGWNKTKTSSTTQSSITMADSDETVYAIYKPYPTLTYVCNNQGGSTDSNYSKTQAPNTQVDTTRTCTPKSGKRFLGWNRTSTSSTIENSITMPSTNLTVYAIYEDLPPEVVYYNLTYNCSTNGGLTSENQTMQKEAGEIISTSKVCTAPEGYRFTGWSETSSGSLITGTLLMPAANKTIYGKYEPKSLNLTYDCSTNGGLISENETMQKEYNSIISTSKVCTAPEGYSFTGWSETSSGSLITGTLRMPNQDIIIYGKYEINNLNLTYDCSTNGGLTSENETMQKEYNSVISTSKICTAPENSTFIGWSETSNGSLITGTLRMPNENKTIYGKYKPYPNLTYDCHENGGLESENETNVHEPNSNVDTSKVCTPPTGYKFKGWSETKTGIPTTSITIGEEDKTIYGIYELIPEPDPNNLIYDCETNGGVAKFTPTIESHKQGDIIEITVQKQCEKAGYKFKGWSNEPTGDLIDGSITMPNSDKTIYGIYEKITCDLNLTSSIFKIDQENKIIYVENNVTNDQILNGVVTTASKTIEGEYLLITCEGKTEKYKIERYWIAQTGNPVLKYQLLISIMAITLVLLLIVNRKMLKEKGFFKEA